MGGRDARDCAIAARRGKGNTTLIKDNISSLERPKGYQGRGENFF